MLILLFVLVWIVFNGQLTLEIALFGVALSILMYIFVHKFMGIEQVNDGLFWKLILPATAYFFVLLWEIIKANYATAQIILSSKYDNEPVLVEFDVPLRSNLAKIILANSITLTPGTITVELADNHYTVHCLDRSMAVGLDNSVFVKRLCKMEEMARPGKKVNK